MNVHPRSLLITGGAGFIGANFVHYWLREHPNDSLTVLDALTYAGNRVSLAAAERDSRLRFEHGDIKDNSCVTELLRSQAIDTVVHFAAESHVDRSISAPDAFLQTNVMGTHSLLAAARAYWSGLGESDRARFRFHHVSTDEVFGSLLPGNPAFHESTAYAPNSPYAASKAASDHLVRSYHRTYGLPVTTSNCSNNYGPYQFPEKLIPLMLVNALDGKPLGVYGDGLNWRDWLHVDDHCRGIDLVLQRGRVGEVYVIGGGTEVSNLELVRMLCSQIDARFVADRALSKRFPNAHAANGRRTESAITFIADRLGHDLRYAVNGAKARSELGYAATRNLTGGLAETVAWYLEHEAWWRPLVGR